MTAAIADWTAAAAILLLACSAGQTAKGGKLVVYRCADGRTFSVRQDVRSAEVNYFDEHYRLKRRPSGLGTRYGSHDAALIIDGDFAAFVTKNIVDLEKCRAVS